MKHMILLSALLFNSFLFSQVNCNIFAINSPEREACLLCEEAIEHKQGSRESQLIFDKAIQIAPNFAWAYYEKSVPFFKRGFIIEGLEILNKAVELAPLDYLCYRAYWYWQYQNYNLCIKDLTTYYALPKSYIQFTPGGEKNMKVIMALAYAKTNNYKKAITILEKYIANCEKDYIGLSDYHTLGILYLRNKQYNKAIIAFQKQIIVNEDIPDTYYFLGLAYKEKMNFKDAKIRFSMAINKFQDDNHYRNPNAGFRIYIDDVKKQIESIGN